MVRMVRKLGIGLDYDHENESSNGNLINPNDYDVVICVKGTGGRLFEHGVDRTKYLKSVLLEHEAGKRAKLTVTRHVYGK